MGTSLGTIKRMAADILGVGVSRVWIDPEQLDRVATAITRDDVKKLVKDSIIKVKTEKSISRFRWKRVRKQRAKGLRKGLGSRKGTLVDEKKVWMAKVKALRKFLKDLRKRRLITRSTYRMLYIMVKGGAFQTRAQLKLYLKEKGLIKTLP